MIGQHDRLHLTDKASEIWEVLRQGMTQHLYSVIIDVQ